MKTKLLLTIALTFNAVYAFAQCIWVTVDNSYSKCDTCFVFTAHITGPCDTSGAHDFNYQWTFTGASPTTDTGKTVTYCSPYVISSADTLYLTMTYINNSGPQITYYSNILSSMLPGLGANITLQLICIVTVDTTINKNLVVWEQTTDTSIVSYNLYKETATTGIYNMVANIPRSSFSTYTDTASQPDVKSARYYLTTMDSCNFSGSESPAGPSHKTMHLTVSSGAPPAWNLVWETYEGLSSLTYHIWRKSVASGWQLIDSVSSSSTTYSDLTPPAGLLYYLVEMISPNTCNPSFKTSQANSGFSSSVSNVAYNNVTGISENNLSSTVRIFPNPFTIRTTLQTDRLLKGATLTVCNSFGQQVKQMKNISGQTINLHRDNLPCGVYFIRITQDNTIYTTDKLIITD